MIVGLGLWLSRTKEGHEQDSKDYFLAGGTLLWWAIGASLIAANISAEHFIGMSGSGFRIDLGIAAYEWLAAITLILVAKYLLPLMIEKKIYTMPQLAKERYGQGVVVSSLASMLNSTSTIFTLDTYKTLNKPAATERELVHGADCDRGYAFTHGYKSSG